MKNKIPTIIAVVILMAAVGVGVLLVQNQQIFRIGASPDIAPQDVRISNANDSSVTISWATDKATAGSIKWGETVNQIDKIQPGEDSSAQNTHLVSLNSLAPQKTYYFKIASDGVDYDNSGIPWQAATGEILGSSPNSKIISGTVMTATGEPASGALVYLTGTGIATLSAKTTSNGSFVIPMGNLRNSDLTDWADLSTNPLLQLYVQAGPSGVSNAQFLSTLTTIPTMLLGKTYDLRDQSDQSGSEIGDINLNIPTEATPASKFNVSSSSASPAPKKIVTLESIDEKEIILTTKPELIGEGPAGTIITITIQSTEPITGTTTVSLDGTWVWNPPKNLAPGNHIITISWKDASGALRKLTRNFVVSAAEGPAFEATPSASPLIKLPASATPSATPRVLIPATTSGIPISGVGAPTMVGILTGILLIVGAFVLAL